MRKKKRFEAAMKRPTSRKRKIDVRDVAAFATLMVGVVGGLLLSPMFEGHEHETETAHKPHHGGVTTFIGTTEYELRMEREALTLYIFERESPVIMSNATLLGERKRLPLTLRQSGSNEFGARGDFAGDAYVSAVATVTGSGSPTQVEFALR